MSEILLVTLNARYIHCALGLRYLKANMGALEARTEIAEFTIERRPVEIVEEILARRPRIVGFGVYVWNAAQTLETVALLRRVAPGVTIVLGGPNVSFDPLEQPVAAHADHILTGPADLAFAELCAALLAGERPPRVIPCPPPPLERIELPYRLYDDEDIARRIVYVEASRGCPFKCEFCLSALDKTAKPFDLDRFLAEMERLHRRGLRHFKFVDRTFNLNTAFTNRILEFFLERLDERLFLHFEVIPDRLPEALKAMLTRFPPGTLQFEIGVQSFDPATQARISRRQNDAATEANLRWLRRHTHAHLHADLIAALPGEDLASFGRGFDRLFALGPHEIQLGILKRLPGAPIARHDEAHGMVYSPFPPYEALATAAIDFPTLQRLKRFARYWDLIANSGRFPATLALIADPAPFDRFMTLSDWLFRTTDQTHGIALRRLFTLLRHGLVEALGIDATRAEQALLADYRHNALKGTPDFSPLQRARDAQGGTPPRRQRRHGGSGQK